MIGNALCQLYVGELNPVVNEEILFNLFSKFGKIISIKVMRHIVTGESRGFGFINFSNPGEASRAKGTMNAQKFFGNSLKIFLKTDYDLLDQNANIVFQNLPESTTEEQVLQLISPIAKPFSVKVIKNEKKPGEARAFVQYDKMESAKLVLEKLNGSAFHSTQLVVEFTNRKNKVFIKAKYHEKAIEELRKCLSGWKYEEGETPDIASDKSHYIIMLKMENEEMANKFLEDFQKNPAKYPIIEKAVDKTNLKTLKSDFSSDKSQFYCTLTPLKQLESYEKVKGEISSKFESATAIKVSSLAKPKSRRNKRNRSQL